MKQVKTISQLIAETDHSRTILEKAILDQSPGRYEIPGVCGIWTIKDLMAHITVWENRMMEWLNQILYDSFGIEFLDSELDDQEVDAFNEKIFKIYVNIDFEKIKNMFFENHQIILDYIARLPEDRLFDPNQPRFQGDHPLWHLVAANTYQHYEDHFHQIENMDWKQISKNTSDTPRTLHREKPVISSPDSRRKR